MQNTFSERLKELRVSEGYKTQKDLARAAGLSSTEISRLENMSNGEIAANVETILKISALTNVDLNWLLRGQNFPMVVTPQQHITEQHKPEQCAAMRLVLNQMYKLHMDKNADYSSENILMVGQNGLAVRIWDKTARLLNLEGYDLVLKKQFFLLKWWFRLTNQARLYTLKIKSAISPKNEPLVDTYADLTVYSMIGLIHKMGKWGK